MKKVAIDTNIYAAFKAGNADIVELFRHCVPANIFTVIPMCFSSTCTRTRRPCIPAPALPPKLAQIKAKDSQ